MRGSVKQKVILRMTLRPRHARLLGQRQEVRSKSLKRQRPDPLHALQIAMISEWPQSLPRLNDPPGQSLADPRQLRQLGPVGRVHIDQKLHVAARGPVDLDQPVAERVVPDLVGRQRDEPDQQQAGDNHLIGTAQQHLRARRSRCRLMAWRHEWPAVKVVR